MAFKCAQKVLFRHCDPAGMVFYPKYFEMLNDCVEAFFDTVLDWPFETLHETGSVPTVATTTEFTAPSRHGDRLTLTLQIEKIGRTSLSLKTEARSGDELRFRTRSTLVHIGLDSRPTPWPQRARAGIEQFMEQSQ